MSGAISSRLAGSPGFWPPAAWPWGPLDLGTGSVLGWLQAAAGLFLAGLAIRLLDDALDQGEDREAGVPNLAERLGPATAAYAAAALALAALVLPRLAPATVLAAYGVGMAGGLLERLPTRMPAWAEAAGALLALFLLVPAAAAWSLLLMGALQAADRWLDRGAFRAGQGGKAPRAAGREGGESAPVARSPAPALLAMGLALLAAGLAPGLTAAGLVAAAALELAFKGGVRAHARG
ncbi:hypothetical protein [Limnochorda pilosa]|uniref:Uncharacterized protein n=1 Tax=Limnochorda pilosa TaxID=1555112 RepID=A0A0K2SKE4_LIMPI|nr:hypothetical protein [Limnochorda pilosa]BAS27581.1 hypothetical protein LIP_1735 [Limnochorda pilosa]